MSKALLMGLALLCVAGTSWSQLDSARTEPLSKPPAAKPASDDPQQRRAAVREALEAQREQKSKNSETAPPPKRQLSPQERLELRQQLRQQRS